LNGLVDFDALSKQVDHIYDAVLNPASWPVALDGIAALSGGRGLMMLSLGQQTNAFTYASREIAEPISIYIDHWLTAGRCPRTLAAQQKGLRNGVWWDGDFLDQATLNNDAIFHEYARSTDLLYAATRLTTEFDPIVPYVLATPRSMTAGAPVQDEMRIFEMLTGHLVRALQIYQKSNQGNPVGDGVAVLLNQQDCGVSIVDTSGNVIFANDALRSLAGDGIRVSGKRFVTASRADQKAFDRLVAGALKPGLDLADIAPIALSRPSGKHPLLVQAMPFRRHDSRPLSALFRHDSGAIILIADPNRTRRLAGSEALKLLGLTEAEARIAIKLGMGDSPESIADVFSLSVGTVRNHMKRIFRKLDISRQNQLVAFLVRLTF
jgi:DNA-binding CsgD family transcriptional regulator/PAS domain-containing protein